MTPSSQSPSVPSSPQKILPWIWWPLLLTLCVSALAVGMARTQGPLYFNISYAGLAVALFWLERWFPHEQQWLQSDRQFWPDLLHTVFNKGLIQLAVVGGATIGISVSIGQRAASGFWPVHWPLAAQITLGLVIAEFGLYWAHRLGHEWMWLWRFHAVHHSATRLWFFNTGRFHFVDTLKSILLGLPLLFLAGAPGEIFIWISAITAYIGLLTHCNVEMRFGPLNYLFNTPGLHRWHHSTDLREGNKNYGENLMIFDLLLGTFFNESRRPPAIIGIAEAMPASFLGQIRAPFVWNSYQQSERTAKQAASAPVSASAAETIPISK